MIKNILELLFREKDICFICSRKIDFLQDNICLDCREKLNFVGNFNCDKCGKKIEIEEDKIGYCRDCQKSVKYFKKGISLYVYEGMGKEILKKFKFQDNGYLKKTLGFLLSKEIEKIGLGYIDMIIPVPMTIKKINNRGYNQSELLGSVISKKLNIEMDKSIIIKVKNTAEQNKIKGEERRKNLQGAFSINNKDRIKNKKILLIDDVYTTGSTVNEISRLLKENNCKDIYFATIATSYERKLYNY